MSSIRSIFAILLVSLISLPYLVGAPWDTEEFRYSLIPSLVIIKAILAGNFQLWNMNYGFGLPLPFVQALHFHPLIFLFVLLKINLATFIFYFSHLVFAALFLHKVCDFLKISKAASVWVLLSYFMSSSMMNYVIIDFWITHFVGWSLLPFLVYCVLSLLHATERESKLRFSTLLGFGAGFGFLSAFLGHFVTTLSALLIPVLLQWRVFRRNWRWFAYSGLLALLIGAAQLCHIYTCRQEFRSNLQRLNYGGYPVLVQLKSAMLGPYFNEAVNFRVVFFGTAGALLALLGVVLSLKLKQLRFLSACFVLAIVAVSLGKDEYLKVYSAMWNFRDAVVLFGTLLGGLTITLLLKFLSRRAQLLVLTLLFVTQAAQLAYIGYPHWHHFLTNRPTLRSDSISTYGNFESSGLVDALKRIYEKQKGRIYFSDGFDQLVEGRSFENEGIGVNSLPLHGLPSVTGEFKGHSHDPIYPDLALMYGRIKGQKSVGQDLDLMTLLDIRYLVATSAEDVAEGLMRIQSLRSRSGIEVVVYENPHEPTGAHLFRTSAFPVLPLKPACENDRFLCFDVTPLLRLEDRQSGVRSKKESGEITLHLPPIEPGKPWLLLIPETYRKEWKVVRGSDLVQIFPAYGAFIGLRPVAGTAGGEVVIKYTPSFKYIAYLITGLAWVFALLILAPAYLCTRTVRNAEAEVEEPLNKS